MLVFYNEWYKDAASRAGYIGTTAPKELYGFMESRMVVTEAMRRPIVFQS